MHKYQLTYEESILWKSISLKASDGYKQFCKECEKDDNYWGWPWVYPYLNEEESNLLNKIYEYYYPHEYIVDPISVTQADYALYTKVKDKIKMNKQ